MEYLGAWGTLIHEKKLRSKISCQTPFKSTMLHKMLVFTAGIELSSSAVSCYFVCVLPKRGVLPSHTTYYNDNSLIVNSFTQNRCLQESVPQRNQFLTRNQFCGIDAWGPKRLKIRAQEGKFNPLWEKTTLWFIFVLKAQQKPDCLCGG